MFPSPFHFPLPRFRIAGRNTVNMTRKKKPLLRSCVGRRVCRVVLVRGLAYTSFVILIGVGYGILLEG